jgi:ribosome-associated translation inhibitor RaiA
MKYPIQVIFRNIDRSVWLERVVNRKAKKLDQFYNKITNCRVIVGTANRLHHYHNYYVHIYIAVPNDEIVVNHMATEQTAGKEAVEVINDAFDIAVRQLEDYVQRKRHQVKTHRLQINTEENLVTT